MTGFSTLLISHMREINTTAIRIVMVPLEIKQYVITNKDTTVSDNSCSSDKISAYILLTSEVILRCTTAVSAFR